MGVKYIDEINDLEMDKWISNLRSGKFSQIQGLLAKRDGEGKASYCCLGVQAVGCGLAFADQDTEILDDEVTGLEFEGKAFNYLPPSSTIRKLNLPEPYVSYEGASMSYETATVRVNARPEDDHRYTSRIQGTQVLSVTHLNDTAGYSFEQIADRLEDTFLRKEFKK